MEDSGLLLELIVLLALATGALALFERLGLPAIALPASRRIIS